MSERTLLSSLINSREAYDRIIDRLLQSDVTDAGWLILGHVRDYYHADPSAQAVDHELLVQSVERAVTNPKQRDALVELTREVAATKTSPPNVVKQFIAMKREVVGSRLAAAIVGGEDQESVNKLLAEYDEWNKADALDEDEEVILNALDLTAFIEKASDQSNLIKIAPKALNDRLDGGLLRGHHVVVFARPEMGKTLFIVNMIAGFLSQNLTVLYVGNEEPVQDTYLRVVCRLTGRPKYEVLSNPDSATRVTQEKGIRKLHMASLSPGTPRQVEELVEKVKADVLIVDQLRNIQVKEDNFTQQLEKVARAVRQIGKRTNTLVVSVTQAGDSATNKSVLEMGDVDSSNTGIPAQADLMVGIGADQNAVAANRRTISLPKNKRGGTHEYFSVLIDPQTSLVRGLT